jgi:hypothetical protein
LLALRRRYGQSRIASAKYYGDFAMSRAFFSFVAAAAVLIGLSAPVHAAMYKWVDEKGITHYGDHVPARYKDRAGDQLKKTGRTVKTEQTPVAQHAPTQEELDRQRAQAKGQMERQRQDNALLSTYASEAEIDQARDRELRRNSDVLKHSSAGLARSKSGDDKRKLDSLIVQSQQENDAINAKFDAQKARYRELMGGPSSTQTAQNSQPSK